MPNLYGAPEIDVRTVAHKLKAQEDIILLDVRERIELLSASLDVPQTLLTPMTELARSQLDALPEAVVANKDAEIIVICHHGVRSAQVTAWLIHHGWTNVVSMAGGIDAYAREIDPTVGFY